MNTDIQDITATRKTVTVTFSADEAAAEEARLVKDFQNQARVPGFRPGKAPEAMIRSRFGKAIRDELRQRLVSKAHQDGVQQGDFTVFEVVDLAEPEPVPGEAVSVSFTVDLVPEFDLPEYTGLKVESAAVEATAEEVDRALEGILEQRADYSVVERAAGQGDYVRCSYDGSIDGQPVTEIAPDHPVFGSQKVTWEEAGAQDSPGVQAVADGLVGMAAGEEKDVEMAFPEDFPVAELAGKTAVYHLAVEEVREKTLPPVDEAFLESLNVESEAALREQLKADIEGRKQQENARAEREQITQQLLGAVDFPLPESGVEAETRELLTEFMQRNLQQGVTQEQFEENKEQLHNGASQAAASRIKSRLILAKIAEAEKIKVENEDLSRMIMQEAMMTRTKPDKLVKELQKDQARVQRMRREVLLGKTMDFLVEKAERTAVADATAGEG